ncbi:MAG: hypothetical protein LC749_11280 [Actinobacteria bacterium]|nr:hypothetical protein [Actinomycetota bacterium]
MPERQRRPDLDERFSLFPDDAEDVLERLLGTEESPGPEEAPGDESEEL